MTQKVETAKAKDGAYTVEECDKALAMGLDPAIADVMLDARLLAMAARDLLTLPVVA
jgi:hypothetical protein